MPEKHPQNSLFGDNELAFGDNEKPFGDNALAFGDNALCHPAAPRLEKRIPLYSYLSKVDSRRARCLLGAGALRLLP